MKKLIIILFTIIMCATMFAGCLDKDTKTGADKESVSPSKTTENASAGDTKDTDNNASEEDIIEEKLNILILPSLERADGYANYIVAENVNYNQTVDDSPDVLVEQTIRCGDLNIVLNEIEMDWDNGRYINLSLTIMNIGAGKDIVFDPNKIRINLDSGESGILIADDINEVKLSQDKPEEISLKYGFNEINFAKLSMIEVILPEQEDIESIKAGDRAILQIYINSIPDDKQLLTADYLVSHVTPSETVGENSLQCEVNQQIKSGMLTVRINSFKIYEEDGLNYVTYNLNLSNEMDRIIFLNLRETTSTFNDMKEYASYKANDEESEIIRFNYGESVDIELTYNITDLDISKIYFAGLSMPAAYGEMKKPMSKPIMIESRIVNPLMGETPTPLPTATPAPQSSLNPMPTPTPTPPPTPTPSQEPIAAPFATPSPIPEITPVPELNLPNNFFGSGGRATFGTSYKIAQDNDLNIYYVDEKELKKIDAKNGSTSVYLTAEEIGYRWLAGVRFVGGKLYVEIETGDVDIPFTIYDVQENKIVAENVAYNRCYFNNIIMNYIEGKVSEYEFLDINTGDLVEIDNLSNTFRGKYVYSVYSSDDYIIFWSNEYIGKYPDTEKIRSLYFVDAKSYKILGVMNCDKISKDRYSIVHCEGNDIYIAEKDSKYGKSVFSKYNVQTGLVTTLTEFSEGREIISFNPRTRDLYFTYSANYEHQLYEGQHEHEGSEDCLTELGKETGVERFMKINIDTKKTTLLNEVSTWEIIQDAQCIKLVNYCLYSNFMFAISETFYESPDPDWFNAKFYLGSEIDYDTWRD